MTRMIAEYLDRESRHRAVYINIDENATSDEREKSVREQIAKASPGFIKVRRYYRKPLNVRGKP